MPELKKESITNHVVDPKTKSVSTISEEELKAEIELRETRRKNIETKVKSMDGNQKLTPSFFNMVERAATGQAEKQHNDKSTHNRTARKPR